MIDDESLDPISAFEITSLLSSTEYEANIQVIIHEFGESELSDAILIRTLPAQLSGNRLRNNLTHFKTHGLKKFNSVSNLLMRTYFQ